ncbi:hypothetical protein D3C78_1319080 [compost metagenome]
MNREIGLERHQAQEVGCWSVQYNLKRTLVQRLYSYSVGSRTIGAEIIGFSALNIIKLISICGWLRLQIRIKRAFPRKLKISSCNRITITPLCILTYGEGVG